MVELIQISDLHYGSEFQEKYLENILSYIKNNSLDAVVCSGDIVHKGRFHQYQEIVPLLEEIRKLIPFLAVPGNHDAKNNGLIFFERFIGPRRSCMILEEKNTMIVGVCSAKDDLSRGEIGDEQLDWLGRKFSKSYENRIMVLHHHLIPVPYGGRKYSIVCDAGEILEMTQFFKIDLVLMGHKHVPHAYIIGSTVFLYCGTSTSNKVRADESPSFNHIILKKDDIEVFMINSATLEKHLLLSRKENNVEFIRPRRTRIEHLLNSSVWDD
ncbi:MAG: metallophosphoesterase family protein [Promethearchaeota archaeon]